MSSFALRTSNSILFFFGWPTYPLNASTEGNFQCIMKDPLSTVKVVLDYKSSVRCRFSLYMWIFVVYVAAILFLDEKTKFGRGNTHSCNADFIYMLGRNLGWTFIPTSVIVQWLFFLVPWFLKVFSFSVVLSGVAGKTTISSQFKVNYSNFQNTKIKFNKYLISTYFCKCKIFIKL
jgi:hypothetical protein